MKEGDLFFSTLTPVQSDPLAYCRAEFHRKQNILFQCTSVLCTWKCAANSMTGMSPSRWHFGRCCRCSEGQKHVLLLSQFQKECKTAKGVQRCVVTGLTPGGNCDTLLLGWLQLCLLTTLSPHTNMLRQMSLSTAGWILPARESPGSRGGKLLKSLKDQKLFSFPRFNKQKSTAICQQEIFSIQRNTETQTLRMELHSPCNAITSAQAGACLTAGVYSSSPPYFILQEGF